MDSVIETAMSLSYFMINNNISHTIRWYDKKYNVLRDMKITSTDDFSSFLGSVFSSGMYTDNYNAFMYSRIENNDMTFSHTIYISSVISDEIFHNLSVLSNTKQSSYLYINDEENICIMVNEEDHLRVQTFSAGLELENLVRINYRNR